MSRRLFDFTIKEWQGSFPEEGEYNFVFSATIDKESNSGTTKKIKRECTVFCESNDDNGFSRTVKIKTATLTIEAGSKTSSTSILLNKFFSIYNNSTLKVKFDGTIIGIENYLRIKENWEILKEEVEENYKGSSIRRFIRSVDNRLETEEKMIVDISSYENFGLLFYGIYGKYDNLSPVNRNIKYLGIKKLFSIQEDSTLTEINDTSIIITLKGNINTTNELTYSGVYQINNTSQWIEKASITTTEFYNGIEFFSEFYLEQKK
ncbi:hypothetical protein ACFSTE_04605 [Aquimarina hainanensis]|uniref:Phage tail protein n=1 Tax=Aquimarina hainanensis TaxID=1578017 RepID=A0ABW5N4T0_9FLAO